MIEQIKNKAKLARLAFDKRFLKLPLKTKLKVIRLGWREKITAYGEQIFVSAFIPPIPSPAYDSYLKWISDYFKGIYAPKQLCISLTNRCLYNCRHCSNEYQRNIKEEITKTEIKRVVDFFKEKGLYKLIFTGGEPLLRPDIAEILAETSDDSFFVALNTSGCGLSLEKAEQLKKAGLTIVKIGLDFIDEKINDSYKGYRGSFANAIGGIKNSLKAGLYVNIQTVAGRNYIENPHKLFEFAKFFDELGVPEIHFFEPKPCGRYLFSDEIFSAAEKIKFNSLLRALNRQNLKIKCSAFYAYEDFFGCMAGLCNFYLDAGGDITPCAFCFVSLGNIREDSLEEIYARSKIYFSKPNNTCLSFRLAPEIKQWVKNGNCLPLGYVSSKDILIKLKK